MAVWITVVTCLTHRYTWHIVNNGQVQEEVGRTRLTSGCRCALLTTTVTRYACCIQIESFCALVDTGIALYYPWSMTGCAVVHRIDTCSTDGTAILTCLAAIVELTSWTFHNTLVV